MELGLRDYYLIIKKRFLMIGIIVLLASVSAYALSAYFMTPVYEASTKLIVVKSEVLGDTRNNLNMDTVNTSIRLIDTYKEIIMTPRILDAVIANNPQFGLKYKDLVGMIKVSSVNNTQVMTVIITDESYNRAMKIANAVSKEFQFQIPSIMKVDNVSLLNQAAPIEKPIPVSPRPVLNTAIAFVISLMLAIGLAFLLDYIDDTIKSEDDVRRYLELPTLALIAKINPDDLVDKKRNVETAKSSIESTNHPAKEGI